VVSLAGGTAVRPIFLAGATSKIDNWCSSSSRTDFGGGLDAVAEGAVDDGAGDDGGGDAGAALAGAALAATSGDGAAARLAASEP